jgi:hypothetical protein
MPSPLLQLSEEDSRSLELNNILSQLQDQVEIGNLTSIWIPELKNILRIFSSLLPTFDGDQLAQFQTFFEEIARQLLPDESMRQMTTDNKAAETAVREFSNKMYFLIEEYSPFIGRTIEERKTRITNLLRKYFKLTPKAMGLKFVEATLDESAYPFQSPRPASSSLIAPAQVREVEEAAEGAEAGTEEQPSNITRVGKKVPIIPPDYIMEAMDDSAKEQYYNARVGQIEKLIGTMKKGTLRDKLDDLSWALPEDIKQTFSSMNKEQLKDALIEYYTFGFSGEPDAVGEWAQSDWETFNDLVKEYVSLAKKK